MSNSRLASGSSRVGLPVCASCLLVLIISVFIVLPPSSRARFARLHHPEAQQIPVSADQKLSRLAYVPGHILVRYRSDATAKLQQRTLTALSVEGRNLPISIEH